MTKQVSIGTAYSEAAAFLARERRLVLPLALALIVLPVTVSELFQPDQRVTFEQGFEPWMVLGLLAVLLGLVGQMAVSGLAMVGGQSIGATIGLALRRLPGVMGAFLLFFLVLTLAAVPLILVITVASGALTAQSLAAANGATILLLLAMIPRILLTPAMAMRQRLGPWALVKANWRATRGQYWRLVGFFALFMLASLIFALAVSAVVGSVATLALGKSEPLSVARLLVALAGGLAQAVIATLFSAMIGRIVLQLTEAPSSGM